jgi:NADH-quinone oxidoreductase subunit L
LAPVAIVLAGMAIAFVFYKKQNNRPAQLAASLGSLYRGAYRKFYIDELYLFITHQIVFKLVGKPAAWIDKEIVDGSINGLGNGTEQISTSIKGIQSGKVQTYAMVFFAGILVITVLFVYWWI